MEDSTCSCKSLVIDSLLCYASTARHSMKSDDIIRICLSFYKEAQIIKSKDVLCELLGEKGKRRRNENKLLNEMKDIMDMLSKCDDNDISLPKFIVDSFDGLPPTSGFEVISNNLIELIEEIGNLRQEVSLMKTIREEENVFRQDIVIIKEDLLAIRGDIRKINHNMISENIRRDSLMFESITKSSKDCFSDCGLKKRNLDVATTSCCLADNQNDEIGSASPSAPPFSQSTVVLDNSPYVPHKSGENWNSHAGHIQDEGGHPSAPEISEISEHSQNEGSLSSWNLNTGRIKEDGKPLSATPKVRLVEHSQNAENIEGTLPDASYADMIKKGISTIRKNVARSLGRNETIPKDQMNDAADGFRVVQNRRNRAANIVGSRKANGNEKLRGAFQVADIYLGNCNLDVTAESIIGYIRDEMNIEVQKCESLESRNKNCKSFKICLKTIDRPKLLVPEVWPEGIVCRKFFNPRKK